MADLDPAPQVVARLNRREFLTYGFDDMTDEVTGGGSDYSIHREGNRLGTDVQWDRDSWGGPMEPDKHGGMGGRGRGGQGGQTSHN